MKAIARLIYTYYTGTALLRFIRRRACWRESGARRCSSIFRR